MLSSASSSVEYAGNGVATDFAVPFLFLENAHLVVTRELGGSEVVLVLGVDYTLTGAGDAAGGSVTLTSALANGATLTIERTVPLTQPTSFRTQGSFSPATHENAFDRVTMVAQQHDRAITAVEGRASTLESRATSLEGRTTNLEQSELPVGTQTVVATGSVTARSLADRFADVFPVRNFGLTVNAASMQAAIDAAEEAGGGIVQFPRGIYLLTAGLTVQAANITLRGEGGTILQADDAATFEHVLNVSGASGFRIEGLTVNARGRERKAILPQRAMPVIVTSSEDVSAFACIFKGALGDPLATLPGVQLGLSAVTRANISGCTLIGNDEAGNESDGIYAKGTQIIISGCIAKGCRDTGFVLESCQRSGIVGCTSDGCAVGAAITIDGADVYRGNYIDGLTVYDWSAATGGVAIGIVGESISGTLRNTRVSGLTMEVAAGGVGQAVYVKNLSTSGGIVQTVELSGLVLDGAGSHCLDVGSAGGGAIIDVKVTGQFRKYDVNGSCIVIRGNASQVVVHDAKTFGGQYGILSADPDDVTIVDAAIDGNGQASHGIYFAGTEAAVNAARAFNCYIHSVTSDRYLADPGVTPLVIGPDASRTESGFIFGHQGDTALYRLAANVLRTPDSFSIGADLDHDGANVGFYGAAPAAKPTVSGSRGGNAALQSLLSALATLGLITDSTS